MEIQFEDEEAAYASMCPYSGECYKRYMKECNQSLQETLQTTRLP